MRLLLLAAGSRSLLFGACATIPVGERDAVGQETDAAQTG